MTAATCSTSSAPRGTIAAGFDCLPRLRPACRRLVRRHRDKVVRAAGYIAMSGQIVDASLVAVSRQRNTQEEEQVIKESQIPNSATRTADAQRELSKKADLLPRLIGLKSLCAS